MPTPERRDQCGSLWRRWDLHFHTPASFDYADGGVTSADIVAGLRAAGVSVVAITDHHTMDVDRFEELRSLAGDDLTLFPGIELRCELGGKEAIHYIGIFPESANVRDLWASLQGKLDITPSQVTSKTDERIWVSYEKGSNAIRELGGLVSIHAGKKSNSFENIKNDPPFKPTFRTSAAEFPRFL